MPIQKALVVDDSKSARFSIKKMLEKMSVDVDFAVSAEEAITYLGDHQPDIIFMDHLMPGMDGFEATQTIKKNKEWATIPVVMCTSKEGSEYLEQAQSFGAIDILPKPATLRQITVILEKLGGAPKAKTTTLTDTQKTTTPTTTPAATAARNSQTISAGMSRDAIEKLARDTANGVAKHALESLVEDRLKQFRRELLIECESVAQQSAEKAIKQAADNIQSEVIRLSKPQLKEVAGEVSREVANNLIDARFNELSTNVLEQVSKQLADQKSEQPSTPEINPALLEEVKKTAHLVASQKAVESAEKVATEIAKNTATSIAEASAEKIAEELIEQARSSLESAIKSSQRKSLAMSTIAIIAAIGTIAVYFLK